MPTYPPSRQNKACRQEDLPYIFGQAITDIPPLDGTYEFRVLRMERVSEPDKANDEVPILTNETPQHYIQYNLVVTGQTVQATNSPGVKVRQGNKVILTQSRHGYDIFCDCSMHKTALVMEPSLPMLIPNAQPNFAGTDSNGTPYDIEKASRSISFRNALCAGTLAVEGTRYFPIQATYRGGERYMSPQGEIRYRMPGELRYDDKGKPVYLMRRVLAGGSSYLEHKDNSNQQSVSSGTVPSILGYLDSPYKYEYIDGSPCPIGLPPNITATISLANWATTTDPEKAQYNFDLFLCPKQAEGEPIVPNSLINVSKQRVTTFRYPMRNKQGQELDPQTSQISNVATIPYYEADPPTDRYFTKVLGQAVTVGFNYSLPTNPTNGDYPFTFFNTPTHDLITVSGCSPATGDSARSSPNRKVYANALLESDGAVKICTKHKVVNSRATAPSRGVFRIKNEKHFFPVLFSLATERGYGVPCQIDQIKFENGSNATVRTKIYYDIARVLIDPQIGKYVLQLVPTEPYMNNKEIESLPFR